MKDILLQSCTFNTRHIEIIVVDMVSHHIQYHENSNYLPKVLKYSDEAIIDICHNDPQDKCHLYHITVQRNHITLGCHLPCKLIQFHLLNLVYLVLKNASSFVS